MCDWCGVYKCEVQAWRCVCVNCVLCTSVRCRRCVCELRAVYECEVQTLCVKCVLYTSVRCSHQGSSPAVVHGNSISEFFSQQERRTLWQGPSSRQRQEVAQAEAITKQVEALLKNGALIPCISRCKTPLFPVKKKTTKGQPDKYCMVQELRAVKFWTHPLCLIHIPWGPEYHVSYLLHSCGLGECLLHRSTTPFLPLPHRLHPRGSTVHMDSEATGRPELPQPICQGHGTHPELLAA
ncbi:uncharacterized protein LOC130274570 [Hyla sarda]|uniref:uncharacterized protein LOC130274570 n=1 Tax=Hyla sarda TaxID=327740 RepID=UPI0024C43E98|nr:uncharacterized protein LOC130274570 [Hyla sarda]